MDLSDADERARARVTAEESLRLFEARGDTFAVGVVQRCMGMVALHDGAHDRAWHAFSAELAAGRAAGDRSGLTIGLYNLGIVAQARGDYSVAAALYEESLALDRELGLFRRRMARTLCSLADVALAQGELRVVRARCIESLGLAGEAGDQEGIAEVLEVLAGMAAVEGAPLRALRLAGAAAALREQSRRHSLPFRQAVLAQRLAPARQALSATEQTAAWTEGQALTLEQVLEYAVSDEVDPPWPAHMRLQD